MFPATELPTTEFIRDELQAIRAKANYCGELLPDNLWKAAFKQLEEAADVLDTLKARHALTLAPFVSQLSGCTQDQSRVHDEFPLNSEVK